MDLTNASAIVTGGAGGFGSATVRRLAQMGAKALTVRATRSPTSENSVNTKFREYPFRDCMKSPHTRTSRLVMRRIMAAYTNASPLAHNLS
jgi:NAD(P)-dependent dehydrogenase (short-subunit alcohol dehydrogenase family)